MINVLIVDDEPFIRQGLLLLMDWNAMGFQICGKLRTAYRRSNVFGL